MALRSNTTGFTGNSPLGSGIEYKVATDYFSVPPISVLFSFKVHALGNGSAAGKGVFYFFGQVSSAAIAILVDPVSYSPNTFVEIFSSWTGATSNISFYLDNQSARDNPFQLNTWYDVALCIDKATGDGGSGKVYGCIGRSGTNEWYVTVQSTVFTALPVKSDLSSWLGAVSYNEWCDCSWDNVKIWNAYLSVEEVRAERQKRLNRSKDLHTWLPTFDTSNAACLINRAGNGKNWTEYYQSTKSDAVPTIVVNGSPNGWGSSPIRTYGSYEGSLRTYYRALVLQNGKITTLPTGQEGTGKKALILNNGQIAERTASEGTPIVLKDGKLTTINTNTEGIII